MKQAPLFERRVRVRLNAPTSAHHGHTGTVDATELERVHGKDKALTLNLDDVHSTIAYADELEVMGSTPPGGSTDNTERRAK